MAGANHSGNFAGQTEAGALAETETADVFVEGIRAQVHGDFGAADVGGLHHDVVDGQRPVAVHIAQNLAAVSEAAVLAVVNALGRDGLLLQGGRNDHDLEGGAGLEHFDDRPVFRRLDFRLAGMIRVEGRARRHGQHLTGARTHVDGGEHVRVQPFVGLIKLLLDDFLQFHVDGQLDGHAIFGRTFRATVSDDFSAGAVALGRNEAVLAAQIRLHHHFNALHTVAVVVEEPENVAEAFLVGIKPARLRLVHHAADPLGA